MSKLTSRELVTRITDYLASGGLFNPEAMEHDKVRYLLIACRDALSTAPLADEDGPGEEDGPWAEGWEQRTSTTPEPKATSLRAEIASALNRCSAENGSDTPDFILAQFLVGCLAAFDSAVKERRTSLEQGDWYEGRPNKQVISDIVRLKREGKL